MTKQYTISEAEIKEVIDHLECGFDDDSDAMTVLMLQSLPELTDAQPVAWLAQWHIEPTHYSEADGGLELVEPNAEGAFAVYTHAQPLRPITADDVTDEMLLAYLDALEKPMNYRDALAAACNAVIKHRGDK